LSKITEFEKKAYDYIKLQGEISVTNIPKMMWGAIPNLKNAGLVKIFKRPSTPWASKKHKFVKAIEENDLNLVT
jgi:hypothetical protein